jgi:hypothetical protein
VGVAASWIRFDHQASERASRAERLGEDALPLGAGAAGAAVCPTATPASRLTRLPLAPPPPATPKGDTLLEMEEILVRLLP